METPPLVYCPENGISCPLDGRQFSTFTQFIRHVHKKHADVLQQECDVLCVEALGKDLARQIQRDKDTAEVAAKLPKPKGRKS